ncbi:hypothetical protein AH333_002435 [Salmonella enterica subsp. salamae]|nr:hypothetical protein [Salmonella enterica subsp. salamae]
MPGFLYIKIFICADIIFSSCEKRYESFALSLSVILCNCHRIKGDRSGGHRTQ